MKTLIVIPARLESTRLPRKLLLAETGKPLLLHTIERAEEWAVRHQPELSAALHVLVAADCETIQVALTGYGWRGACLRTGEHPNGTSRMAEAAQRISDEWECFGNVQADEPEIDPSLIDEVVTALEQHPEWDCATAALPLEKMSDAKNTNRVKAFMDAGNVAWHFSRDEWQPPRQAFNNVGVHIGIYAYRREALLRYAAAGPCEREQAESLEQLRALHIGLRMGVVLTDKQSHGIDTREDYDNFVKRYNASRP